MKIPTKQSIDAARAALPETPAQKEARLHAAQVKEMRRIDLIGSLCEPVRKMRQREGMSGAPLRPMTYTSVVLFGIDRPGSQDEILARIPEGAIYEISDGEHAVAIIIPRAQREWFADYCSLNGWGCKLVSGRIALM